MVEQGASLTGGESCRHRLTLEEVGQYVSTGEELTGVSLIKLQGGCRLAAEGFLVNPPYCAFPNASHKTCSIACAHAATQAPMQPERPQGFWAQLRAKLRKG